MKDYISVSEAKSIIENQVFKTTKSNVSLLEAQGFYTSEAIFAPFDVPSFDNSAMDGYGFRFDDLSEQKELKIVKEISAGKSENNYVLNKGEVVRIFTGAKIPEGVDTVIMQEKVTCVKNIISFDYTNVKKGDNIRKKGSQSFSGEKIINANTFLNYTTIGFLAGFGIEKVMVYNKPKIGLLCTGNELVEVGTPLSEGEIYNSNSFMLQAALREINQNFTFIDYSKDSIEETTISVKTALEKVDVLLITGGISVGDYDYVKNALEKNNVTELFYKVNQKPGKPLYFGRKNEKYVFALPGNPASVFSCYEQYVKPFLKGCLGKENIYDETDYAISENFFKKINSKQTQFLKAYHYQGKVSILDGQESYKMNSTILANCILEFPENKSEINIGDSVKIWKI